MKFLRYFVLGALILQTFGLTAMNTRQKAEVIKQITQSFAKDASWFGDSKNVEELKALINKLATVERGSKDNYLKLLNLKIETAQALKKSSSSSTQPTSVEIKTRQESYTPSPKTTGVATVACTQTKQENAQTPSTTTTIAPAKEPFITYRDAIKKVNKIIPQSTTHTNALAALSTLAKQGNDPRVTFDAAAKIIYIQESAVDAIIAKYAPSKTRQPQEKQFGSDKTPSQPIKQSIKTTQANPLITFADAKRKITEIVDTKHQELALQDLATILVARGIKGEDTLRRITEPDLSSIIEKYLNSGDTGTTVETKKTTEKQSYSGQSSSDDLVSSTEALTMLKQAVAKANLKDSKTVQEEAIADLDEISKSERAAKKANITYFYRSDVQAVIDIHIGLKQLHHDKEQKIEEEEEEGIAAGTLVGTPTGLANVEQLHVGYYVLNFDLQTQKITHNKIKKIVKKTVYQTVKITINSETIEIAPDHLFYLPIERTWIKAKNLTKNNIIFNVKNKLALIQSVETIKRKTDVYALSVENVHNFTLSNSSILVHNFALAQETLKIASGAGPTGAIVIIASFGFKWIYDFIQSKKASQRMTAQTTPIHLTPSLLDPQEPDDEDEDDDASPVDLERITLKNLDPAIGNLKKLEKAVNAVKDIPGAMAEDGPITRLLKTGTKGANSGDLATARGAIYEIEKAYDLIRNGEKVEIIGTKIKHIQEQTGIVIQNFDIDIVTSKCYIECKNWDWSKMSPITLKDKIDKIKNKIPNLQKMAKANGKTFELHSKFELPDELRSWLSKHSITFFEG